MMTIASLRATLCVVFMILNAIVCCSCVSIPLLCRWVLLFFYDTCPKLHGCIDALTQQHARHLRWILQTVAKLNLNIHSPALNRQRSSILIMNHRSWMDIIILMAYFADDLPPMRFFLKKSLFWLPWIGPTCYGLGHIFIEKNPSQHQKKQWRSLIQQQRHSIAQQCAQQFRHLCTLVIFVEGTRFSPDKKSPYQYLLSPQAMGLSIALEQAPASCVLMDATIVYGQAHPESVSLWQGLCGHIPFIDLNLSIHESLPSVHDTSTAQRKILTQWLQELWRHKDHHIQQKIGAYSSTTTPILGPTASKPLQ